MASYELMFKKSAAKDLRVIPKQDLKRVLGCIQALATDSRLPGRQKLSAQERYRLRQGAYRIVYEIADFKLTVLVVKVLITGRCIVRNRKFESIKRK